MAAPSQPRYVVLPRPTPPSYGLESVIQWLPAEDAHIFMGIQAEPLRCDAARLTGALQCDDESPYGVPKETARVDTLMEASPFAIYGEYECNPVGRPLTEAVERATAHLQFGRGRALERAVQFGEAGNEPNLISTAVDLTPSGGPVSLVDAVARLEQHLGANYGGIGVIHMDRRMAAHAVANLLVYPVNGTLQTGLGTLVVAGSGYDASVGPGESPGESPADDDIWIFATGAMYGWRQNPGTLPDTASSSIDRRTNTMRVIVEQAVVVTWECVTAAVRVSPVGIDI